MSEAADEILTSDEPEPIDTSNRQMVGIQGNLVVVVMPKHQMTRDEALLHAAWLVVLASMTDMDRYDETKPDFETIYEAVRNL